MKTKKVPRALKSRFALPLLKDETMDAELRLSEVLSAGCDGARWVGYGEQGNDLKQQK